MSAVLRTWLGFLALGAGLVHIALTIGSELPVALVLLLVGAVEFVWGVFVFVSATPPLPRIARSSALVPVIGWALLLVVAGGDPFGPLTDSRGLFPMLVASVFDLLITLGLTVQLRRPLTPDAGPHPVANASAAAPRPRRRLAGVIAGALVIAAITAPALAATEVGQAARPSTTFDLGGHGH